MQNTLEFKNNNNQTTIVTSKGNFSADVLIATGRIPNTDLALEETGVELGERGEIKVNEHLQTSVEHIYLLEMSKAGYNSLISLWTTLEF